jgi:hypothetical protein
MIYIAIAENLTSPQDNQLLNTYNEFNNNVKV